jgi:hypothetical protein
MKLMAINPAALKKKTNNKFSLINMFNKLKERTKDKVIKSLFTVKEALSKESAETKVMLKVYLRYTKGEAKQAEMKMANAQFRDLLKTLGLGALAVLPFAPLTIPTFVKIGRKFGVDIIPSSLRSNKK